MRAVLAFFMLIGCGGTAEQASFGAVGPTTGAAGSQATAGAPSSAGSAVVVAGSSGAPAGGTGGQATAGSPSAAGSTAGQPVGGSGPQAGTGGFSSTGEGGSPNEGGAAGMASEAGAGGALEPSCTTNPAIDLCEACPITLEVCPDAAPVWHYGDSTAQCAPDDAGGCAYAYGKAREWQKACCNG